MPCLKHPKETFEVVCMRTTQELRNELLLKEIRTAYWELNHRIPSRSEIDALESEVTI